MALVSQIKTTLDPDKKSEMVQTIKLRICGEPSDRSVCCTVDQRKVLEDFILLIINEMKNKSRAHLSHRIEISNTLLYLTPTRP